MKDIGVKSSIFQNSSTQFFFSGHQYFIPKHLKQPILHNQTARVISNYWWVTDAWVLWRFICFTNYVARVWGIYVGKEAWKMGWKCVSDFVSLSNTQHGNGNFESVSLILNVWKRPLASRCVSWILGYIWELSDKQPAFSIKYALRVTTYWSSNP